MPTYLGKFIIEVQQIIKGLRRGGERVAGPAGGVAPGVAAMRAAAAEKIAAKTAATTVGTRPAPGVGVTEEMIQQSMQYNAVKDKQAKTEKKAAKETDRWTKSVGKARSVAKNMTNTAMTMLGVFFSGLALTMMLERIFGSLAGAVMDLNSAMTSLVEAQVYSSLSGTDFASVLGESNTSVNDLVNAHMNAKAASSTFNAAMVSLASTLFNDKEAMENVKSILATIVDLFKDEAFMSALKEIIASFKDWMPVLKQVFDMLKPFTPIIAKLAPIFVALSIAALPLMPLFSALAAVFQGLTLILAGGGAIAAAGGLVGILTTFAPVILAVVAAIGAAVTIGYVIYQVWQHWGEIMEWVGGIIDWLHEKLRWLVDTMAALGSTIGGALSWLGIGGLGTGYSNVNIEQHIYGGGREAADEFINELGLG